jgi:hypothetical protein
VGDFSERQVRILRWMRTYVAVHGEAPPSSVLDQLEALGAVKRRGEVRRRAWLAC